MENPEELSPKESLHIISDAIAKTKDNIREQSFYYLLWGWFTSVAAIMNYLIVSFSSFEYEFLPWAILMPLGGLVTVIYSIRYHKHKSYETYLNVFLKYLWIVLGVSFILAVLISLLLNISPAIFILMLAGIGTLISGFTMKFKPLILGGVMFFVFSVSSIFVDDSFKMVIFAAAIIIGYLIPAYIIKRSK